MQSETGFASSHQLKSYVAYKSRMKLAASAVLSADAAFLCVFTCIIFIFGRPFVKWFALYYQTVVCLSLFVSDIGVL